MNSRSEQQTIRGILVNETSLAIAVKKDALTEVFWFPRSQIGYLKKYVENASDMVEMTVPEWLIEKKNAWSLVP